MYITEKLHIGKTNRVYLTDANLSGNDDYTVTLSVVDETGTVAVDAEIVPASLVNKACTWDATLLKYYFEITFATATVPGFFRLFWLVITTATGRPVSLQEQNEPQTVRVIKYSTFARELVPVQWFLDHYLYKVDISDYPLEEIRESLKIAQGDLEMHKCNTFFSPTTITDEVHDYYYERFSSSFWIQQLHHTPLISITSFTIKYGDTEIATLENDYVEIDKDLGTVEIMPTQGGYFYTLLSTGLSGMAFNTLAGWSRIPLFFHITYQAGLNWDSLGEAEKMSIRHAIGMQAAINLLPKLDSRMGLSSESRGVDGTTESFSYTSSAMYGQNSAAIEQYQKDLEVWVENFRRKYGKNIFIQVA